MSTNTFGRLINFDKYFFMENIKHRGFPLTSWNFFGESFKVEAINFLSFDIYEGKNAIAVVTFLANDYVFLFKGIVDRHFSFSSKKQECSSLQYFDNGMNTF